MEQWFIIGFFGFLVLLSLGTWFHAQSIEPAHEYYEDELREAMGNEEYEESFGE